MPLEPGQMLSHYRLVGTIGAGGMGVVWKARDEKLRRDVALKFLPAEWVRDPERRRRLLREARAAAAINHPNIGTVYEVDEADGTVFIAMELVEGKTLRAVLVEGSMRFSEALRVATSVAEGLVAAHQARVIHRDMKPENVLVRPDGFVKILDFGLATLHDDQQLSPSQPSQIDTATEQLTRPGQVLGTPAYMSPEQVRGEAADARSDIFSYGSLLYEMVTGRAPFQKRTHADTLAAVLTASVPPPSDINSEIPGELERIMERCLKKEPVERYQNAAQLVSALRPLRERPGTHPRPVSRSPGARGEGAPLEPASRMIRSLVVLPLTNVSGDVSQDYFADGLTDSLIMNLSRIRALRVISRTSAMHYRGTTKSVPEIAGDLKVDAIVEGSVLIVDEQVRISVQLIAGATDSPLWGASYDRALKDILALQSEVAQAITNELRGKVTPGEKELLAGDAQVSSPAAYLAYLKGRFYWNKRTETTFRRAIACFEEATALEPDYALAHVGLADTYQLLGEYSFAPTNEAYEDARSAANRALAIQPELAEAHASLAEISVFFDWDWPAAEEGFQKAIRLNPNYATAHLWYSDFLTAMGRHQEALSEINLALQLDPLSVAINGVKGGHYYFARQYDEAIAQLEETLRMNADFALGHLWLGLAHEQSGRLSEAVNALEAANSRDPKSTMIRASLAHAYALSGDTGKATAILEEILDLSKRQFVAPFDIAIVMAGLKRNDQAQEWLEEAYRKRSSWLVFINVDSRFDVFRSNREFNQLLERIGFH